MFGEEMHYPKFLDILKNEISTKVHVIFSRKLHPSGWRGIESNLLLLNLFIFFTCKYTTFSAENKIFFVKNTQLLRIFIIINIFIYK